MTMGDDDGVNAATLTGTFFWTEDELWDREEVPDVLAEAARRRLVADIALREGAVRGTFVRVSDKVMEFDLEGPGLEEASTAAMCCVSFEHEGQPCFFLSAVEGLKTRSGRPTRLLVACPAQLEGPERREGLRVRVEDQALTVRLFAGDKELPDTHAVELGLTDLLVAFSAEDPATLLTGTRLRIELGLSGKTTALKAQVQRVKGHKIGLRFLDETGAQAIGATPALLSMIVELENLWFQQRRKSWMMLFGRGAMPRFASHEDARCVHCDAPLSNCHATLNRSGFGQFVGDCRPCGLFTWYDID